MKENNAKPKHKSSIQSGDMPAEIESILHGSAEHGRHLEDAAKLVEFLWFSLCFHFARRAREE